MNITNVRGMNPTQIGQELKDLMNRAEARGHFFPTELRRYEDLVKEKSYKEELAKQAKEAAMRAIGAKIRKEAAQKRLDAQSPRVKDIVSRSNSGTRAEREAGIRERRAK